MDDWGTDEQEAFRRRVNGLELQVARIREDATTTRMLAVMADREVSELKTTILAQTPVLNALRQTQKEQGEVLVEHTRMLHTLDNRLTGVETRVAGLETRVAGLETRVADLETAVTRLDDRVTGLETAVTRLDDRVTGLETAVTRLDDRVTGLETAVTRLDDRVAGLETRVIAVDDKVTVLATAFADQRADLVAIRTLLESGARGSG